MKKFKCPICKEVSSSKDWNDSTVEIYYSHTTKIDSSERSNCNYICPICKENIDGEQIVEESVNKFVFFNDTRKIVNIHPATLVYGCSVQDDKPIKPLDKKVFILPENTYPMVKLWDYGEALGLQILVSAEQL